MAVAAKILEITKNEFGQGPEFSFLIYVGSFSMSSSVAFMQIAAKGIILVVMGQILGLQIKSKFAHK